MTDETTGPQEDIESAPDSDANSGVGSSESTSRFDSIGDNVSRYVLWAAFLLSLMFAGLAAINLYFQVGHLIDIWIEQRFQPIFQAAFNLIVLLIAVYVSTIVADKLEILD